MSINVDFLFVDQQMQKLFQHQSANRTSSSSTKLSHPICTTSVICIIPVQHAHLHSLCISSTIPIISDQHALLIQPKCTIPDQQHFSSSLSAPYQYNMHSTSTPFPPPQSSMHSSNPSAHQTPTGSSNPIQASRTHSFRLRKFSPTPIQLHHPT